MKLRPPPQHPAIAEAEAILTARRVARVGVTGSTGIEDDAALGSAIIACDKRLGRLHHERRGARCISRRLCRWADRHGDPASRVGAELEDMGRVVYQRRGDA
jgi:hypothetical protein